MNTRTKTKKHPAGCFFILRGYLERGIKTLGLRVREKPDFSGGFCRVDREKTEFCRSNSQNVYTHRLTPTLGNSIIYYEKKLFM